MSPEYSSASEWLIVTKARASEGGFSVYKCPIDKGILNSRVSSDLCRSQ